MHKMAMVEWSMKRWDQYYPRGRISVPGIFFFFTIPHLCLFLPPPHQTIWRIFSPCLRICLCATFLVFSFRVQRTHHFGHVPQGCERIVIHS